MYEYLKYIYRERVLSLWIEQTPAIAGPLLLSSCEQRDQSVHVTRSKERGEVERKRERERERGREVKRQFVHISLTAERGECF